MRLTCPICGDRDRREFHYLGSAGLLDRPEAESGAEAFHDYIHLRENPAGPNPELWTHEYGCRAWLHVMRDTVSHRVLSVALAREIKRAGA